MADREKVIKGLECCSRVGTLLCPTVACPYFGKGHEFGCSFQLKRDAFELLKKQSNCVSIPFDWLTKFCTHIDFHEPMSDEERAERWKEKLSQQFGVKWDG